MVHVSIEKKQLSPEVELVARQIAREREICIERRQYTECMVINKLTTLSKSKFKKSLNWLVAKGYVVRVSFEEIGEDPNGRPQLVQLSEGERRDYNTPIHWKYKSKPELAELISRLDSQADKKASYFVS